MENEDYKEVLKFFKEREAASDIIPIITNEDIQRLVVAWPKIVIKPGSGAGRPPEDPNERWKWLWRNIVWCEKEFLDISGVPEAKFKRLLNQVKGNRLIYPDGTVSSHASKYLSNLSLMATARLKSDILSSLERVQKERR